MITNVDAKVQTYNSPHLQLDLSKHHDENSAFMPITVIGHANIGQANLSQANIQRTDSQLNIKP